MLTYSAMGSKNQNNKPAATVTTGGTATKPEPEPKTSDGGGNIRGKKLIADARFAFSQSDPRFQTHKKQKSKVKIDSRFNRMFTDKNFSTSSTSIDKRGKAKRKDTPNPLKHYYRMDEEVEDEEVKERNEDEEDENETSSDEDEEVKERNEDEEDENETSSDEDEERKSKLKKLWEKLSESESESGSEMGGECDDDDDDHGLEIDSGGPSDSDFDSDDEVYSEEEKQEEENIPEIDKETSRLAVVSMDWNQVKAVDLYVLLSSFLPKHGHILSVSVYPSDFGLKRMEEEAVHGPIGLFDDDKKRSESDEEDDEELDNEKLRAYELSRLRYYYAVVECDSIATADYLYKTCDGVEFERSSNKLDLRFIPDSMEIKHTPRDVAKEAPTDYEGVDFQTRALQQSKIQLTWDEDEPQRSKTLKRKYNADQLAELELKEFLASDESESDEDENDNGDKSGKRKKKQEMYQALIQSGGGSNGDEEEEEGQDMEVTFNTGLEDISKKILEKRDKKSETIWEAYQRKKREKKKSRKNRSKDSSDDDSDTDREPSEESNDFFIEEEEPVIKEHKKASGKSGKKGKKAVEETAEEEASRAELELLLADNNGESAGLKGYNLKRKKGKGKKGEDVLDEEKIPKVDYDDERFSSLFTSHLYALDPTDPQYKRSAAHARQIAQKKRVEESNKQNGRTQVLYQVGPVNEELVQTGNLNSNKEKYEISSMVKSIKMKARKVSLPSNGKTSGRTRN